MRLNDPLISPDFPVKRLVGLFTRMSIVLFFYPIIASKNRVNYGPMGSEPRGQLRADSALVHKDQPAGSGDFAG